VIAALDAHRLAFTKKNIANREYLEELKGLGGVRQVPYLIDDGVMMYESADIVVYLEKTYGDTQAGVTVHNADDGVCSS
jgi:glutathione S-transferase